MFLLPKSYWEIRSTKNKGRGVFALRDIKAGVVIGDYLGRVIHPNEEDSYEKKHGFYSMYYHNNASIFPDPKKNGIHIINHSCAPNCWMYTYKGHTLYFAIRNIFKGEELTISYLLGPQGDDCNPCEDQCRCKSINCTQTMHMPEKKYKAWVAHDDKKFKKTKAAPIQFNTELSPLPSYPKTIPDNTLYTLIGSPQKAAVRYDDKKIPSVSEIRARIRKTGRYLLFRRLNMIVNGVIEGLLIAQGE